MPKPKLVRIYWDACAWIAYIAQEKNITLGDGRFENRYAMCYQVLKDAQARKYEIVTSAFTLAEVCKEHGIRDSPADNLPNFFDSSYILVVPLDKSIGARAQNLQTSGLVNLKPPDAIHLASAQRAGVLEMHTFDKKILNFDGKIGGADGKPIKICKPTEGEPIGPLFENDECGEGEQTTD